MPDSGEEDEDSPSVRLACVALEVLSVCLSLHSGSVTLVQRDRNWQGFIADLLLICKNR